MGLFGFGKKSGAAAGTKTLVAIDWDRISGLLTDLSFLKDKKNPHLHIYSRKPGGVLLQDLQKKYPTQVHTVPQDERNFSNYMSCSVIYEYARNAEFGSIVFVFEGQGLGSTQRFLEAQGIKVTNVQLGQGEDRRNNRRERPAREPREPREGRARDPQQHARQPREANAGNGRNPQGAREPRQDNRNNERNTDRNTDRNANQERTGRNRDRARRPRYEATPEDATRMAGRFRELFNLFKDYPQEQLVILVKQATEQDMQVIFGSRNPRVMVEALVNAGIATVPAVDKINLSDFPSETFCRQLLRVNGERLPRPERKPQPAPVEDDAADDDHEAAPQQVVAADSPTKE
jgi:hypothetical protein